jgi:hypothetical protein
MARRKKADHAGDPEKGAGTEQAAGAELNFDLVAETPSNGRLKKSHLQALEKGNPDNVLWQDTVDLTSAKEREKAAERLANKVIIDLGRAEKLIEALANDTAGKHRRVRRQAEAGSAEAAPQETAELLDSQPDEIRRPLCLVAGHAYAAAWCKVRVTTSRSVDSAGHVVDHDPPLVQVEDRVVIVRADGGAFADGGLVPGARPLAALGLPVRLPHPLPPGRGWSGAGVKRYLAGEGPDPAEVFGRLVAVVDRFLDFDRSLAPQETMCDLVACYVLATWLLDAFHVVGYLWPNGEPGSGKTTLLQVVAETAYLGQLILAGSSYPTLRDLADYGATLAFDDAEAVMDTKRTDPDKRTLLLAGYRRGATIAVKELVRDRWETRHVNTFCPRLFSAIRLPDGALASRTVIMPLVRSGDEKKTKASVMDPACWPTDRARLVDDLWAVGLANLPALPEHDRAAADCARLTGRALEPWRAVLAVSHWLEQVHQVAGLYGRMEKLSVKYHQEERDDYEEGDSTRVLFRALLGLTACKPAGEKVEIRPAEVAAIMNSIAKDEDLADPDKHFTTARKVGWLLRRQRFRRGGRSNKGKTWEVRPEEIRKAARAHGVEAPAKAPNTGAEQSDEDTTREDDYTPF